MLDTGNWSGLMFPCGPLFVTSANAAGPAVAFVVTHTRPPVGVFSGPFIGPSPLVVAYTTFEPLLSVGRPAARARTRLTSLPVHVPAPSVSKFGLSAVKPPPVRPPRHTRQEPTSIAAEEF